MRSQYESQSSVIQLTFLKIEILDEIQTGLRKTGKLLAEGHEEIPSDLILIRKALSA